MNDKETTDEVRDLVDVELNRQIEDHDQVSDNTLVSDEEVDDNLEAQADAAEAEETVDRVVAELPTESIEKVIEARRQSLMDDLITKAPKPELEVAKPKVAKRDPLSGASNVATDASLGRPGMSFGGGKGRRLKQQEDAPETNPNNGTFKIYQDKPVNNIGKGTNQSDIAAARRRNG